MKSAELAAYTTPEIRTLFEEWARSVQEEVLSTLKSGPLDLEALADDVPFSPTVIECATLEPTTKP